MNTDIRERIERYIERTRLPYSLSVRYDCYPQELIALLVENRPFEAMALAFSYGRAKGYRAAKAEAIK